LSRAVCFTDPSGALRLGALADDDTIRDAGPAGPGGFVPTPAAWAALAAAAGPVYALADVRLAMPVVPGKLVCIGLNYRDHAEEQGQEIPALPMVFAKYTSALIGPEDAIVLPYDEPRPDWEAELALVIGTRVRRATGAAALASIGGMTAFNDVSGREAQFGPGRQFTRGKSYDTFAPIGPCVASVDGVDLGALGVKCTVSGEVMQDSSTAQLIFGVQRLVEFCSAAFTLEPGDVIATGTPPGVGDARKPPRYLVDGDVVEVEVEGIGVLRNPCVAEARPA
jgi:2-keto-4-pentenoate hydratase/2-oxohepta-3-ene-1,7-dioic acid hydratase in catechol pathway